MDHEWKVVLHGLLIDGTGAEPVPDSAVLIRGQRIEAVGGANAVNIPAGTEVIDATGKTVLPGIIEGHAHVADAKAGGATEAQRVLRLSLQRGITTVCSVSAETAGIALRDAIEEGQVRGCARLVAGCVVTCTNGHVKGRAADGPWEVRKAVREAVMAGADFIKTAASGGFVGKNEVCSSPNYTLEELTALTVEAHAWGKPVVAHCHTQPGLGYCIEAGVDQIHHGAFIDEAAVRGIKERELFYMPTLAVTCDRNIQGLADQPWQTKEMIESQPVHRAGVRLAHECGVTFCVGTDYPGNPRSWDFGDRTLFELQELVRCGLTPMAAIVAATRNNAAAYRLLDKLGTLEPGKQADMLVVTGNPAADVSVLYEAANINVVLKDGVVESADAAHQHHYRMREDVRRGPRRPGK
ncbi:MAG: amidohydrolase family protein [Kiritimatiellae bacterium]|nr:amidohydrolase family protein [Kiritimatiellia bacterium]